MPSFDVVSELDQHELNNALDQANREVGNRFDFKGSGAQYELKDQNIEVEAETEFQVSQMLDLLYQKCAKRGIELGHFKAGEILQRGKRHHLQVQVKEGLEKDLARNIVKLIKESKLKAQAAIQGEQVRVTGKKRDDLQQIIAFLKQAKIEAPLQFVNFRD